MRKRFITKRNLVVLAIIMAAFAAYWYVSNGKDGLEVSYNIPAVLGSETANAGQAGFPEVMDTLTEIKGTVDGIKNDTAATRDSVGDRPKGERNLQLKTGESSRDPKRTLFQEMEKGTDEIIAHRTTVEPTIAKLAEKAGIVPAPKAKTDKPAEDKPKDEKKTDGAKTSAGSKSCEQLKAAYNNNRGIGQEAELCKATDEILMIYRDEKKRATLASCLNKDDINVIQAKMNEMEMEKTCVPSWRKDTFTYKCRNGAFLDLNLPGDVCKAVSNPVQAVVKVSTSCVIGAGISGDVARGCDRYLGMNALSPDRNIGAVGGNKSGSTASGGDSCVGLDCTGPGSPDGVIDSITAPDRGTEISNMTPKGIIGNDGIYGVKPIALGSGSINDSVLQSSLTADGHSSGMTKLSGVVGNNSGAIGQ